MLNAYQAIIKNGQLTWLDPMPNLENQTVTVIVLPNETFNDKSDNKPRKIEMLVDNVDDSNWYQKSKRIGMSAGKAKFPDDINKYDDEVARLFGVER